MQNISNSAMFAGASAINDINEISAERISAADTTFVLFFLALDLGHSWLGLGLDGVLAALALAIFVVVPYFLFIEEGIFTLRHWVTGRLVIALAGISFGLMLRQATGVLLPDWVSYLPLTLLIVAAIICCNVQIYGILKDRLAR